jgi:PAN domain
MRSPFILTVSLAILICFGPAAVAQTYQEGLDLPGAELRRITVAGARLCQAACLDDDECRAWTFLVDVDDAPNCLLKDAIPQARLDPCCISGVVDN